MTDTIYVVKYEYNHYIHGKTEVKNYFDTLTSAFSYFAELNRDDSCFDGSFQKKIYKVVLDETNEIKKLVMENL